MLFKKKKNAWCAFIKTTSTVFHNSRTSD